ncbi:MAG: FliM/FliN family flagellar motor switch protein [Gammaproteobacteria bacterium]|nr:FliM/FliN family flagellar motor switch protein [Gammaproteobacteria bacterium]
MSDNNSGDNQNAAVLAQAFPQLDTSSTDAAGQGRQDAGSHLQVVPPPGGAATSTAAAVPVPQAGQQSELGMFTDVPVTMAFEVGRQNITVQQLMTLARGSILPLQDIFVDSIEVKVSGEIVARAEAVSLKKRVGVRINEIAVPSSMGSK